MRSSFLSFKQAGTHGLFFAFLFNFFNRLKLVHFLGVIFPRFGEEEQLQPQQLSPQKNYKLRSSMASFFASMAARRAATLSRLSSSSPNPSFQATSFTQRRGLASAAGTNPTLIYFLCLYICSILFIQGFIHFRSPWACKGELLARPDESI